MENDIDYKPIITSISTGVRIKKAEILIEGFKHDIGGLFLDVPIKIHLNKIFHAVTIVIEQLVEIDGISLRKLDLKDIRSPIKKKNYKVSQKSTKKGELGTNVLEFGMNYSGINWIRNLLNIVSIYLDTSLDGKNQYTGKLYIGNKLIGTSKFNVKKCHGGNGVLPNINAKSKIELTGGNAGELVIRLNIPISGLSRDHAKKIFFFVKSSIKVLFGSHEVAEAYFSQDFSTGNITYPSLLTTGDQLLDIIEK